MTVRVGVAGAAGRMGRMLLQVAAGSDIDATLAAAIVRPGSELCGVDSGDLVGIKPTGIKLSDDLAGWLRAMDVLIDFTPPEAALANARLCAEQGRALVSGTTGFSPEQALEFDVATRTIAVCQSANFSPGVNLAYTLLAQAAAVLGEDADIEIAESHHRHKLDAPSGTALAMGDVLAGARGRKLTDVAVFDRAGKASSRTPGTIGFSVLRAGDIVGEHTVTFATEGERLEICHKAGSRMAFARGAVRAAHWLADRAPGRYDMQDVLGLKEN